MRKETERFMKQEAEDLKAAAKNVEIGEFYVGTVSAAVEEGVVLHQN